MRARRLTACWERHAESDPAVGRPLCLDCYDHPHQAVWNLHVGELWRRTMIAANRSLRHLERLHRTRLRLSYTKVAEFQARGAVHLHALVRLDGRDPDNPLATLTPPAGVSAGQVALLLRGAVTGDGVRHRPAPVSARRLADRVGHPGRTPPGPARRPRPRRPRRDHHDAVAAYLAKYATKATEMAGHLSTRLRPDTVRSYTDLATHTGRQIDACWRLGQKPAGLRRGSEWAASWGRLWRWAHMLGFAGHFSTRSRRYSTTLTALRQARRDWQLQNAGPLVRAGGRRAPGPRRGHDRGPDQLPDLRRDRLAHNG